MITLQDVRSIKHVLERLAPISRKLNAINCRQCNGYGQLNKSQEARDNSNEVKYIKEGNALAEKIGLKFYHQTDPRGCSVYLIDAETENYSNGVAI